MGRASVRKRIRRQQRLEAVQPPVNEERVWQQLEERGIVPGWRFSLGLSRNVPWGFSRELTVLSSKVKQAGELKTANLLGFKLGTFELPLALGALMLHGNEVWYELKQGQLVGAGVAASFIVLRLMALGLVHQYTHQLGHALIEPSGHESASRAKKTILGATILFTFEWAWLVGVEANHMLHSWHWSQDVSLRLWLGLTVFSVLHAVTTFNNAVENGKLAKLKEDILERIPRNQLSQASQILGRESVRQRRALLIRDVLAAMSLFTKRGD
jgi:hypothetical protein